MVTVAIILRDPNPGITPGDLHPVEIQRARSSSRLQLQLVFPRRVVIYIRPRFGQIYRSDDDDGNNATPNYILLQ